MCDPSMIVASTVLGTGANILGASKAAGAAKDAANQNNALIRDLYDSNKALLNPYVQQGYQVNPLIAGALGYGDPAQANAAFDAWRNSTGYQAALKSGVDGINTNAVTRGLLKSGANLKAINDYGQRQAQMSFADWYSRIAGQQQVGLDGARAVADAGQNYVSGLSANNNAAAAARGQAWTSGASYFADGLGRLVQPDPLQLY